MDQKGDDNAKVAPDAGIVLECNKLGVCTTMMSTRPKLLPRGECVVQLGIHIWM